MIFLITGFLAACSTGAGRNATALIPEPQVQTIPLEEYKIQVGDTLDIKLFYNPELSDSVMVRPDGRISLQLARNVPVAGLTPSELEQTLSKKYENVVGTPEITVIVRSFSAQKIYVDGQVEKPGMLSLVGPMTILQAIASAGGLKDSAAPGDVIVIRRGENGKPVTLTIDVASIRDGKDTSQDILLKSFDIVYVPKSAIGNVNTWVDLYIRKNLPVALGVFYNPGD